MTGRSHRMMDAAYRDPGLGSSRHPRASTSGERLGKKATQMSDLPTALNVLFTEFYYWITVVIMFLIHIGFCMYEVGASRTKNMMHTLMKNTMLIPLVTITFFFFGWWIYFAFPNGPFIYQGQGLIAAPNAVPWSELMGPHLGGPPASAAVTAEDTALWARL